MGASEQSNQTPDPSPGQNGYIASVDLGTTTLRCLIYDKNVRVCGKAEEKVSNERCTVKKYRSAVFYMQYVHYTDMFDLLGCLYSHAWIQLRFSWLNFMYCNMTAARTGKPNNTKAKFTCCCLELWHLS